MARLKWQIVDHKKEEMAGIRQKNDNMEKKHPEFFAEVGSRRKTLESKCFFEHPLFP